jgi:hypothetical protein
VLMLTCCGSLVVAKVFMVSLARVLENLKIIPACDKLYVHVLHFFYIYIYIYEVFPSVKICVIADLIFSLRCLLDWIISSTCCSCSFHMTWC